MRFSIMRRSRGVKKLNIVGETGMNYWKNKKD